MWLQKEQYLHIPSFILFDIKLDSTKKILFSEILNLSRGDKGCYASNDYFGKLLGINKDGASKQIIYSNNPNSNRALFIAPVTQLLQPEANTFITLSGGTMSQIIKFKPNDNLKFSVYLPDGSLFQTLDIDTLPPYSHQPDLQIDAVFSITRIDQSAIQEIP